MWRRNPRSKDRKGCDIEQSVSVVSLLSGSIAGGLPPSEMRGKKSLFLVAFLVVVTEERVVFWRALVALLLFPRPNRVGFVSWSWCPLV